LPQQTITNSNSDSTGKHGSSSRSWGRIIVTAEACKPGHTPGGLLTLPLAATNGYEQQKITGKRCRSLQASAYTQWLVYATHCRNKRVPTATVKALASTAAAAGAGAAPLSLQKPARSQAIHQAAC
jgi:hypothetical protein